MADRRRKKPAEDATAADLLKEELAERITAEDREAIGAALQEIQKSAAEAAGIAHALRDMGNSFADIYAAMQPEIEGLRGAAIAAASAAIGITDFGKNLRDVLKDIFPAIFEIAREMAELEPYLLEELKKPEYEGKTFDDLLAEQEEEGRKPSEGLPAGTLARKAWDAAKAAKAAAEGRKLRTAGRAGNIQPITKNRLALPTEKSYLNAFSLLEEGQAYITNVVMDGLKFSEGKLYFSDTRARAISEMELQDLKTKAGIENINLPMLAFYYTILFSAWEESIAEQAKGNKGTIDPITKLYVPDLAEARGLSRNASPESVEAIKKDIAAFHNVVGVLKEGYKTPSYYPVLNFEGYDSTTNTIAISSPYLMHVVDKIYRASVRRTKDGTAKLKNNGTPQTRPVNSYLVHSDIQKERNKAAVQSVFIIVQGIERRGGREGTEYKLNTKTLIDRNPFFKKQLESSKNKRQTIQRHFKKTWELLRDKTDLKTAYKNIKLPDPDNPADIPTEKGINDFIITIRHDGKNPKVR